MKEERRAEERASTLLSEKLTHPFRYVYEDDKDISDPDLSPNPKKKTTFKPPPSRSSRRKPPAPPRSKAGPSNLSSVSRPGDLPMKDSITVSRRAKPRGAAAAKPEQTIKLTLKMGKDKLREATSAWTPPAAAVEESSSAESLPARGAGRGRKTVDEEESSDEDEEEDEDEDMDAEGEEVEEEDAEGEEEEEEEDDGLNDEDAEGETDDEEMLDSDDEGTGVNSPDFRSRTGTPDMSRLTKRQKSRLDEVYSADLLELPTGIGMPPTSLLKHKY